MRDETVIIGHVMGQGIVSTDALSQFMSRVDDSQGNGSMTAVPTRSVEAGLAMLRNGGIDYLLDVPEPV